jgi:K+-sensing histidine kinase KdpD
VAIFTSIVATLCFDYFYLPPAGTLNIYSFSDWISLGAFLLASIIISYLNASAKENKSKVNSLNKTLLQIKEFGERLLSMPQDNITLSGIAKETLNIFSLEYCSIHVYGAGKWQHFTGAASSDIPKEIENKLKNIQDHPTDLLEIADEYTSGVLYAQINKGKSMLALLAVKSESLPTDAMGTIAYMIGVQINKIMKDEENKEKKV